MSIFNASFTFGSPFGEQQNQSMESFCSTSTNKIENQYPEYDNETNYQKEFWKLFLSNEIVLTKFHQQQEDLKQIKNRIQQVEENCEKLENLKKNSSDQQLQKKKRRVANEIEKHHQCPYLDCQKLYGSEVSLNLHIKIKHRKPSDQE